MNTLYLNDLVDEAELHEMLEDGRIARQVHPTLPLSIYNYTAKAQYVNEWSKSERVCRGLIVEDTTNKVIARGPEKFFNYGQSGAPEIPLDTYVRITKKEDGSLGIGWTYEGHYGVATRGSFMSEQAQHATAMMTDRQKALTDFHSKKGLTDIWEIVYPKNRIVLDYGDLDELIDLGTVRNSTGLIDSRYIKQVKGRMTLAEALALPIPDDEEGYVLDVLESEGSFESLAHVKLKGETYKLLHGLLTNTNARRIWTQLAWRACHSLVPDDPKVWASRLGNDPEDFKRVDVTKSIEETFLEQVPDEFYSWVTKQIDSIQDNVYDLIGQGEVLADKIKGLPKGRERYELVKDHPLVTEILRYAEFGDNSGMTVLAWKLSKPGDETPFQIKEED